MCHSDDASAHSDDLSELGDAVSRHSDEISTHGDDIPILGDDVSKVIIKLFCLQFFTRRVTAFLGWVMTFLT